MRGAAIKSIPGKCDSPRQPIKLLLGGYNGRSLGMAPDMAVCVLLFLTTLLLGNVGLNVPRPSLEEESNQPCSREKFDKLKTMLEEQVEFYQVACGVNTGPPKVEPKDHVLDLVRSLPEGFGLGITWW